MSGTKDCKFCDKKGLLWLPLRYSAVSATDPTAIAALPKIAGKLGDGVVDLALTESKYAVRLLRPGYLYVLIARSGIKSWNAYMVLENAYLFQFNPDEPPQITPSFSCDPSACGLNASMVAIPEAVNVDTIWTLFTPTPLTKEKLANYRTNADKYAVEGKLQTFSPADWLTGNTAQPHSLLAPEVLTTVAEYVVFTQGGDALNSPLGKTMRQQLFPATEYAYRGTSPNEKGVYGGRLGGLQALIKKNGYAALALYDHIGITQELNNFRNAALAPVEAFLAKVDEEKASNQRKLEVMHAIEDVKAGYIQHSINVAQHQISTDTLHYIPTPAAQNAIDAHVSGRKADAKMWEAKEEQSREAYRQDLLSGKLAERTWEHRYASQLATDDITKFRTAIERISKVAADISDRRIGDHVKWVTADRLVDAFDNYDTANLGSGFCFTLEHSLCTFGMFGNKKNVPLLKDWMHATKVERKNLYMRANLYNQKILEDEAGKAFAAAKEQVAQLENISQASGPGFLKAGKGMIDALKKTDSAWDEWLRDRVVKKIHLGEIKAQPGNPIHNLSKFHSSAEGLMFARISEWTQSISTSPGKLDKGISSIVGMLIYSKLGELAEKIGFDEFMLKIKPEKIAELKAKKQKSAEYQARADQQKQTAQSNVAKADKAARIESSSRAKVEAAEVDDSITVVIRDEQKKVKDKVEITLKELEKGDRPTTNNFRQARIGVLLMAIEGFALTVKCVEYRDTPRVNAEITASVLSLTSMSFDVVYAVVKSIREIDPYEKLVGINKAADVMRGGLKLTAGTFSAAAGAISSVLDFSTGKDEWNKDNTNWVLMSVYVSRGLVGSFSVGLGLIAAFSYAGPMLWRMAGSTILSDSMFAFRITTFLASSAVTAEAVAVARTIWLIRIARLNLIGLSITGVEIIYRYGIMDDDLENWLQACIFRKDKSKWFNEKPFTDGAKEMEALQKAYKAITA